MTRVALTVDTECKECGGTGRGSVGADDREWLSDRLCLCVMPATIQDARGHATLGTAGGMQATNTPPSTCRNCGGSGGGGDPHLRCPRCNGSGDDPEDIDASAGHDR